MPTFDQRQPSKDRRTPSNQTLVQAMIASESPESFKYELYKVLAGEAWSLMNMEMSFDKDASTEDMLEAGTQLKNDKASEFGINCVNAISSFIDGYVSTVVESTIQAKILAGELMSGVPGGSSGSGNETSNTGGTV